MAVFFSFLKLRFTAIFPCFNIPGHYLITQLIQIFFVQDLFFNFGVMFGLCFHLTHLVFSQSFQNIFTILVPDSS